jgi:tetratricopeptide (TPR) repeat protein
MKSFILVVLVSILVLSCATTGQIEPTGNQVVSISEPESTGIKTIGPLAPMVAPSQNEEATAAYNTGTQFLWENKLSQAEEYLKKAIELDPNFVDAMDHLGLVYRRQNRLAEAEEMYLRSIALNSENKVPYQNLAVVYQLQNRLNEAFELYQKIIQIDPNDPEPYYGIGELFYIVGNYANSIAFFDRAIELYRIQDSPYIYDAFFYKGVMYYDMDNYDEALRYLEEARIGNPNNSTIENIINEIRNKRL